MVGQIVELTKHYHVVCDGTTHWKRIGTGMGGRLEAIKLKACDCVKKPVAKTFNGLIPSL